MLSINDLREDPQHYIQRLLKRNISAEAMVQEILDLDKSYRKALQQQEQLKAELNQISKSIGQLIREQRTEEAKLAQEQTGKLKSELQVAQQEASVQKSRLEELLLGLPNAPHPSVPEGLGAEQNEVIWQDELPKVSAKIPHWDLAAKYQWIDFERGVKITGAGFPVYSGGGAKLQRALIQFFLDKNTEAGYQEFQVPLLVNEASGVGTGQLPDKEGQMYGVPEDGLFLIPTAEVPLTNLFREEILDASLLPIKLTGYTPCFRREAGSYGKDVRGLNRLHQFDKVEIVQLANPEQSYAHLEEMVQHVTNLLRALELPARLLKLCGGDTGFAAAMTFDFEVYAAAQERWLEVSSVSNFESFQANRLKMRYKEGQEKPKLLHTLNGSALALPRIVAALMENGQTEEGIRLPKALEPYLGTTLLK